MRLHKLPCANILTMIRHARAHLNDEIDAILQGKATETGLNWESSLTPKGREQARQIGEWLCSDASGHNMPYPLIVSTQVRARVTAGIIGLLLLSSYPGLLDDWEEAPELNERHFGLHDTVRDPSSLQLFLESQRSRSELPLSWKPLNGESLDQVLIRANAFLDNLATVGGEPLIVATSWPIWALRARIEDWGIEQLCHNFADPAQFLDNCDGVQYRLDDWNRGHLVQRRILHLQELPHTADDGWEWVRIVKQRTARDLLDSTQRYCS